MIREFAKLLILIAVLLMPLGMSAAPATAARHAVSMPMQHCPEPAPNQERKAGFAECTMACSAALPAIDGSSEPAPSIGREPVRPAAIRQLHGLHPETATPPPRIS